MFSRSQQKKELPFLSLSENDQEEIRKRSRILNVFRFVFFLFALVGAILGATGTVHEELSMLNKIGANIPIFGLIGERSADYVKTKIPEEEIHEFQNL
ncbi:9199_t:CDS:1, partial [Paraglomus occultum]